MKEGNVNMKEKQNKDRKILIKFIVLMLLCVLGGAIAFEITDKIKDCNMKLGGFGTFLEQNTFYLLFGTILLLFVIGNSLFFSWYRKAKKIYKTWNEENEEDINQVEYFLSLCGALTDIWMILIIFQMTLYNVLLETWEAKGVQDIILSVGILVLCVVSILLSVGMQHYVVRFEKEINPEKRGNVLDTKFQKVWLDSCDEAQQAMIYKASYVAMNRVNKVGIALLVLCLPAESLFHIGIAPVIMITILLLVSVLSYQIEAIKLENK